MKTIQSAILILLFFCITFSNSIAQDKEWNYTTWKQIERTQFGQEVIYKTKEGKTLTGDYKIAENSGAYTEVSFSNGKPNGEWKTYDFKGKIESISRFKNGIGDGKSEVFYQNGNIKEESYWNLGKKTGTWKSYRKEGEIWSEETYKNDLKDGKWLKKITSTQTGKNTVVTEFYKDDKRTGTWEEKDEEGRVIKSKKFTAHNDYEEKEFYPNGQLATLQTYQNNVLNGISQTYSTIGQLQYEAEYDKGYIISKKNIS